jgi:hypothetical protein
MRRAKGTSARTLSTALTVATGSNWINLGTLQAVNGVTLNV